MSESSTKKGKGKKGAGGGKSQVAQDKPPASTGQESTQKQRSTSTSDKDDMFHFVTREEAGRGDKFQKLIDVYANCFRIKTANLIPKVYHYDVTIARSKDMSEGKVKDDSPRINRNINFAVIEALKKLYGGPKGPFHGITTPFDGEKNMYTNKPINEGTLKGAKQYQVKLVSERGEDDEFTVAIQLAQDGDIDMTPIKEHFDPKKSTSLPDKNVQKYIQILDVILNPIPTKEQVSFRRALFDPALHPKDIPQGGQLVQGTKSAVRSSQGGPMLNADMTNTIFLKSGPVADLIKQLWGRDFNQSQRLPANVHDQVVHTLKQQQVEARHAEIPGAPGKFRKYRVIGLSRESVSEKRFLYKKKDPKTGKEVNYGEISIAEYFKREHPKLRIAAPNWPCLVVGNIQNQRYLPIEACYIVEKQPLKGSISGAQQAEMTRETAKLPHLRFKETKEAMQKIRKQLEPQLKAFGLEVNADPILITGCRVLPAPKLVYSVKDKRTNLIKDAKIFDRRTNEEKTGEWKLDQTYNLYQPIPLRLRDGRGAFAVLNFSDIPMEELNRAFIKPLIKQGKALFGMDLGNEPMLIRDLSARTDNLVKSADPAKILTVNLPNILGPIKDHLKLLVVILPSTFQKRGGIDIYPDVKFACDIGLGIPTQCVDSDKIATARDRNGQFRSKQIDQRSGEVGVPYLGNVLQKINAKAGGVNCISQILHDSQLAQATSSGFPPNTMILGADATHPAPGDALKHSVTSIVGSLDPELKKFASKVGIQEPQQGRESKEIIENFDQQVWELIQEYEKVTKKKPSALVFFRDGVSEGQFPQVAEHEALKVIEMLKVKKLPIKVTYIVVTKRHNLRAFEVLNRGKQNEQVQNIPAGTVIDKEIVSKHFYDFYLSSHIAIKGTARAAKYTVLIDQNKLKPNLLEALSFALCCICVRCTRSVSIPVPVMYADLSAYRARDHIVAVLRSEPRIQDYNPDSDYNKDLRNRIRSELAKMKPNYKWGFYYC